MEELKNSRRSLGLTVFWIVGQKMDGGGDKREWCNIWGLLLPLHRLCLIWSDRTRIERASLFFILNNLSSSSPSSQGAIIYLETLTQRRTANHFIVRRRKSTWPLKGFFFFLRILELQEISFACFCYEIWRICVCLFVQGKDMFLLLENNMLNLVDPMDRSVLHSQPIASIRVWGVGRDNGRLVKRLNGKDLQFSR